MKGKVCVTGAEGYIGSWLVKRLLEKGYTVHATVRDPDETKVSHILSLPDAEERLTLFRAELSEDGSFDAAIAGCDGVFHVASPTEFAPIDPENDVIKPAVDGALNVLRACTKAQTVKRVVFTSSASTLCINESSEQNHYVDESCWEDVDIIRAKRPHDWIYRVSKILAEQAAWEYVNKHALDMVTIIPVIVAGPSITPMAPISIQLALSPLIGNVEWFQALKVSQVVFGSIPLVHVEDICSAQIFLMEDPHVQGRHICGSVYKTPQQLIQYLVERYPQYNVLTGVEDVPLTVKVNMSSKKLIESGFTFQYDMDGIYDHSIEYLKTKGLLN